MGAIAVLSYALAFAQRPGSVFLDTRIEMTLDPVRFLQSVASMWSSTGDLGHFQGGQFVGYLVPMAPWYAFAHTIGLSTWLAERIWMGSLLLGAGLGAMLLVRRLFPQSSWIARTVAAVLFLANPYVVVVIGRTSVWLLMYAALPWLLLATHRGLRDPRGWRWPAVVGLLICLANGGANVALTFWILLAPPALLVYEVVVLRAVRWRDAGAFAVRAVACALAVSLWWLVPLFLQSRYGTNPLPFTEQPSGILTTPSVAESLRLLGFWLVYFGSAGGPSVGSARDYLFDPVVIAASFLVPLAAIAGFARARRTGYAPFMLLLLGGGVVAMSLGFPPGSPLNQAFVSLYYKSGVVQALRTAWKAAPLVALPMACLAGLWVESIARKARAPAGLRVRGFRVPAWSLAALAALPVLFALPLFNGTTIDRQNAYGSVPHYWRAAVRDATKATTSNQRIMILPGALFAWYRWGETDDSVAPFLTPRRVTARELARFADPHSSQVQTTIDDLVQQDRLVPGQLEPLLGLLGVGAVLQQADSNAAGSGSVDPADVSSALQGQARFRHPAQSYGPSRLFTPMPGRDGPAVSLPAIRRIAFPKSRPGVVRVQPQANTTVLDGDAAGIAELAADHMLDPSRAVVYAGDLRDHAIKQLVGSGGRLVFTDSNRRQILAASSVTSNLGQTLEPSDPIAPETPHYDLFPSRGNGAQTVAVYSGLRYLHTPGPHASTQILPEDAPYAALDGRLDTAWLAGTSSPVADRYIDLKLSNPLVVQSVRIHPLAERLGITTQVAMSVNGGPEQSFALTPGWNTVPVNAVPLRELRVRVTQVFGIGIGVAGGISELQIPGLTVGRVLRSPTDLAARTRGLNLSHDELAILLARTTADSPYREQTAPGELQTLSVVHAADAEPDIRRLVTLPAARRFTLSGWANVRATAPDPLLDRLAHLPSGWRFSSSGRFEGLPINRASSAFDGQLGTAWVAHDVAGRTRPWIQWSAPRPVTIRQFQLVQGPLRYEFPVLLRISGPGFESQDVQPAANGQVILFKPIRARTVRITVLRVRNAVGKTGFDRFLDAVAIAEIRVPGLDPPAPAQQGRFETDCGALSVRSGGQTLPAEVYGGLAALDAGQPLRLRSCGTDAGLALGAGANLVVAPAGRVMQPDHIALDSRAPDPLAAPAPPTLLSPGSPAHGSQTGIRLAATAPSWLVMGESYSPGWRAWCRDRAGHERALGPSVPIDGFANGWQVGPACVSAHVAFAPQSTANVAYIISAVAIVLLVLLALGVRLPERLRVRRRSRPLPASVDEPRRPEAEPPGGSPVIVLPLRSALAWGVGVGVVTGFVFALRFGVVAGPLIVLLLVNGISVRRLVRVAMLGVLVIIALYVVRPATNYGGYSFYFSLHEIVSHWIGAGVLCALLAAAVLQAHELRTWRGAVPRGPRAGRRDPADGAGRSEPARIGSGA